MLISARDKDLDITIEAPPSKSVFHRELIVRSILGAKDDLLPQEEDNDDIIATKACLSAIADGGDEIVLPCNESGSTLRFMIPVASAYLLNHKDPKADRIIFETKGRLFERPLAELEEALLSHGIKIRKDPATRRITAEGRMTPGEYIIDGSVSSQYISGLLMALPLFDESCRITVKGQIKSIGYIGLTLDVMAKYGINVDIKDNVYETSSAKGLPAPCRTFKVEGDWSNGAFLLCLSEFSKIKVTGLDPDSKQGDKAIIDYLRFAKTHAAGEPLIWKCDDIPDIVPYMAIVAPFFFDKMTFTGVKRLRIKESDRIKAIREQLSAISVKSCEEEDQLTVYGMEDDAGKSLPDVIRLSSYHDHRMAMTAVLIAVILRTKVEIDDIDCLDKSYPRLKEIIRRELLP